MGSMNLQSDRAKHSHGLLGLLRRRRCRVLQLVFHAQPFPLEAAELVERQHLDLLDVAEAGGELGDPLDFVGVVRSGRAPARSAATSVVRSAASRRAKANTGALSMPGDATVQVGVERLETEHDQVDACRSASLSRSPK